MGPIPIREFKRRKKAEKKVDHNVLAAALSSMPRQPDRPFDWWDDFSRRITGPLANSKKPKTFESVFKISRKTFDYICSLVNDTLRDRNSNFTGPNGKPLSPTDQVAIALRRLSSGDSFSNIGDSFGINASTAFHITWKFVEAMEERGLHHLCWPSTEAEMEDIKHMFEKTHGLPNCCGVIDTTHIVMTRSTMNHTNDAWIDQEESQSMILQAIVGPDMRFRDVAIGYPGSLSDALVLKYSDFFKLSEERKRLNGKKIELKKGIELREYIIGDEGFPLLPWLLTPFQHALHDYQVEFNKQHSATLRTAQIALAKLKEMWKIIHGTIFTPDKNKLPRIVFVCCLLHNIVIEMEDKVLDEMSISHKQDEDYQQQICESSSQPGTDLREELSQYLSELNLAEQTETDLQPMEEKTDTQNDAEGEQNTMAPEAVGEDAWTEETWRATVRQKAGKLSRSDVKKFREYVAKYNDTLHQETRQTNIATDSDLPQDIREMVKEILGCTPKDALGYAIHGAAQGIQNAYSAMRSCFQMHEEQANFWYIEKELMKLEMEEQARLVGGELLAKERSIWELEKKELEQKLEEQTNVASDKAKRAETQFLEAVKTANKLQAEKNTMEKELAEERGKQVKLKEALASSDATIEELQKAAVNQALRIANKEKEWQALVAEKEKIEKALDAKTEQLKEVINHAQMSLDISRTAFNERVKEQPLSVDVAGIM